MTLYTTEREHQRLLEVAREYRQRGYEVIVEPSDSQLPDFLAAFRIDMVAHNAQENVIVEVRSQDSLVDAPELDAIAQALRNEPSWRFELVVTNSKDRSSLQFKGAVSLNHRDIAYRLNEARQLSEHEHGEAAFLLAWSATEALLRVIADAEEIPVVQHNLGQLTKSLYTYGLLDKTQYQVLQDGLHVRSTVVHGYKEQQSLANALKQVLHVAEQLLQEPIAS